MNTKILFLVIAAYFSACCYLHAENGYELWLRYKPTDNTRLLHEYQKKNRYILFPANSPQLQAAKEELERGLQGMLQLSLNETEKVKRRNTDCRNTANHSTLLPTSTADRQHKPTDR